jgi:hypothetical protein
MTDSSDPDLAGGGVKRLYKSRYSSVSRFIGKAESPEELVALNQLNDIDANIDEEAYKMLIDGGFDESLASHIAHLFVRDPLVIFDDAVVLDDTQAMVRTYVYTYLYIVCIYICIIVCIYIFITLIHSYFMTINHNFY